MISIVDLYVGHGDETLIERLNVSVETGEILVLLGLSGSGKTTLLRTIAGLHRPHGGTVHVMGVEPNQLYGTSQLHYLHQSPSLWKHLTVGDHIRLALDLVGEPVEQARIETVLAQLGLKESAEKYPHELSRGMQARLALARAFAKPPAVLLVDEPFASLDQIRREQLNQTLKQMSDDARCTIVMVTHDVVEAIRFASRIVMFPRGQTTLKQVKVAGEIQVVDPNVLSLPTLQLRDEILRILQGGEVGMEAVS